MTLQDKILTGLQATSIEDFWNIISVQPAVWELSVPDSISEEDIRDSLFDVKAEQRGIMEEAGGGADNFTALWSAAKNLLPAPLYQALENGLRDRRELDEQSVAVALLSTPVMSLPRATFSADQQALSPINDLAAEMQELHQGNLIDASVSLGYLEHLPMEPEFIGMPGEDEEEFAVRIVISLGILKGILTQAMTHQKGCGPGHLARIRDAIQG